MGASDPDSRRPWSRFIRLLQVTAYGVIAAVVIIYVATCAYMYSIQTRLTYPEVTNPLTTELATRQAKSLGLVPWDNTTPGASAPQGYVRPDFANSTPRGTIIVFHGNGGYAYERTDYVEAFARRGFRVFLYEYPGYGGRPGVPSEAAIVPDAQALIRSLDQAGFGPVYVWGESLGGGVAAAVCKDASLPVHGLVLLTPWDNIANVALYFYPYIPVRLLMIDKYDSIANLTHFSHPICVIRSANDEIIPPALTLNLFAHLPDPKKMILQNGCGHNDWPASPELGWWDDALNFIAPKSAPQ